ncbi:Mediator of RNA polymerase II transcription subunit 36a [Zea mays]|uniref:Mediator of RNA polymerase II transcription subunit 36a n=1 Tax=Zea mays TaxID=4577 RepID=A0A1D6Q1Z6_MAIZE|nr:Mediator of RNA polymerase II transcription subunit 36a [Zea mays]
MVMVVGATVATDLVVVEVREEKGGRGGRTPRGGRGGGMNGESKAVVVVHKHAGVFISKSKEDALCTKNIVSGDSVYGEKRASIQRSRWVMQIRVSNALMPNEMVWNPFRSKLATIVLGGVDNIWIAPSTRVLYLGVASGTIVSHMSDIQNPFPFIVHMCNDRKKR